MRIIIEIDGLEVAQATGQPQISVKVSPSVSEGPEAPVALTPPPEVLEVAAALGADNAGPSPFMAGELGVPIASTPSTMKTFAQEESDKMDAGAAPNALLDLESQAEKEESGRR
jgi:hypothetical protein